MEQLSLATFHWPLAVGRWPLAIAKFACYRICSGRNVTYNNGHKRVYSYSRGT